MSSVPTGAAAEVQVPVADTPDPGARVTVHNDVLPAEIVTDPVGALLPLPPDGVTVAV